MAIINKPSWMKACPRASDCFYVLIISMSLLVLGDRSGQDIGHFSSILRSALFFVAVTLSNPVPKRVPNTSSDVCVFVDQQGSHRFTDLTKVEGFAQVL